MKIVSYCLASLVLLAFYMPANAQTSHDSNIPAFHIALTDSSYFNRSDLKKKQAVMLIYFLPDCEHCHDFTQNIIHGYENFKDVQIVMISNHTVPEIKEFERAFDLRKYKNIRVGTEGKTFLVQRYYQITRFPFVALFDNNGNTISVFRDPPTGKTICKAFKTCRFS